MRKNKENSVFNVREHFGKEDPVEVILEPLVAYINARAKRVIVEIKDKIPPFDKANKLSENINSKLSRNVTGGENVRKNVKR